MSNLSIIEQYLSPNLVAGYLKKNMGPMEFLAISPFIPIGVTYLQTELQKLAEMDPVKREELGRSVIIIASQFFSVPVVFQDPGCLMQTSGSQDGNALQGENGGLADPRPRERPREERGDDVG